MDSVLVFDLYRFAVHDGPGIGTAVFLKGCHSKRLRCRNPEGQDARPERPNNPRAASPAGGCVSACRRESRSCAPGDEGGRTLDRGDPGPDAGRGPERLRAYAAGRLGGAITPSTGYVPASDAQGKAQEADNVDNW